MIDIGTALLAWFFAAIAMTFGVIGAAWLAMVWRSLAAKKLYLGQCDVALTYPQFSNPEGKLDLRAKTVDGDKAAFEQYEWYVARLVYVLDQCLILGPKRRWRAVANTQLANHKHYFGSDYYRKQDYLTHYSRRMRALIAKQQQGAAAS